MGGWGTGRDGPKEGAGCPKSIFTVRRWGWGWGGPISIFMVGVGGGGGGVGSPKAFCRSDEFALAALPLATVSVQARVGVEDWLSCRDR